ncbi:hypothetical protein YC2023_101156 [Brassica napus]
MIGNKCSCFLLLVVNEGGYSNQVWDKLHLKSAIHCRSGGGGQAVGELFDGEQGDSHRLRSSWLTHRRRRGLNPAKIRSESSFEVGAGYGPVVNSLNGVGAAANAPTGGSAQAEAPPIFWDVGMNVVDYTTRRDSPYLNLNVGVEVGVTDNIALANNVVTPTAEAVRLDDGGGSSTGSTDLILTNGRHQVKLPTNVLVGNKESPMIPEPSRELVAAHGLVLASTAGAGSGGNVSDATLPSMMKLAIQNAFGVVFSVAEMMLSGPLDVMLNLCMEDIGDYGNEVAVGMMFRNRDAFKQHMALYAISWKFQYRSRKSEPGLMVLECCGDDFPWRVYAVKLKEADVFEIRKVVTDHLCTVDERGGYQTQATSSVIGELMRTIKGKIGVDSLVSPAYTTEELRSAYAGSILPVPDFTGLSDLVTDFGGMRLCPPLTR